MPNLTDTDREILALEREWFRFAGVKEQVVRERFGLSITAYYQLLNRLLDDPAALAHDPLVVNRLRRVRESRLLSRSAGRLAG